jgi:hypothetical protein
MEHATLRRRDRSRLPAEGSGPTGIRTFESAHDPAVRA